IWFIVPCFVPVGLLLNSIEDWTGRDVASTLRDLPDQGGAVARGVARELDELSTAIRAEGADFSGSDADVLARLLTDTGTVGAAARRWYELVGHRIVAGFDISDPAAREMPSLLVRTIRTAAEGSSATAREEARKQRGERLRDAVPAGRRDAFDALISEACDA